MAAAGVKGLKGLVLAAGFGTRLRPLTELYPKPLMPFAGVTPLALALWRLNAAGVEQNAVNTHHRSDLIEAYARQHGLSGKLKIAHEPEILGTGGVYNPLRSWLGDDDLVVLNGDVVASFDLAALIKHHRTLGAVATMAVLPEVIPGEVGVHHRDGRLLDFSRNPPAEGGSAGNNACAQVLSRAFLELLPKEGSFDIISTGYRKALERGLTIGAAPCSGYWHDLRTPQFYWEALREVVAGDAAYEASGVGPCRRQQGMSSRPLYPNKTLVDEGAQVAGNATLGPYVLVERGAVVGERADLKNSLLLPGAVVAAGAVIHNQIIGPVVGSAPIQTALTPIQGT